MVTRQGGNTIAAWRRDSHAAPVLLSVADVARSLSLGVTYTRRLIDRGEIKSVRIGKRVLVPRQFFDDYVSGLLRSDRNATEGHDGQRLHQET